MVKSDLIEEVSKKLLDLHKNDVELAVNCMFKHMSEALAKGERIEIRGFGSLNIRLRPPRIGRNPKSGESVHLIAKTVTHFKPGKELRDRVNAARTQCKIED